VELMSLRYLLAAVSLLVLVLVLVLFMLLHLEHRASVKSFVSLQFLNLRHFGRTPWTGNQPVARPLPNTNRHPCLEWDSNPRSQCSRGRRHFMP
jgi:hypothetical protein